jgi:hypothetical protein
LLVQIVPPAKKIATIAMAYEIVDDDGRRRENP